MTRGSGHPAEPLASSSSCPVMPFFGGGPPFPRLPPPPPPCTWGGGLKQWRRGGCREDQAAFKKKNPLGCEAGDCAAPKTGAAGTGTEKKKPNNQSKSGSELPKGSAAPSCKPSASRLPPGCCCFWGAAPKGVPSLRRLMGVS